MEREHFLAGLRDGLTTITHPRFFETERGYQGELLAALRNRFLVPVMSPRAILEQEHQKVFALHGTNIRPDIIIHEPFDAQRHRSRREGNHAVVELKLRSTAAEARGDFASIEQMFRLLDYRLGAFVNIDAEETYAEVLASSLRGLVTCFAVMLDRDGKVIVRESRE